MENNDSEIFKSIVDAQEYLEKALKCDNKTLRKKIEYISKGLDKFLEKPRKRLRRKMAKESGITFEMFNAGISTAGFLFKRALSFDDNELREFIELYIEQSKIVKGLFFGAEQKE